MFRRFFEATTKQQTTQKSDNSSDEFCVIRWQDKPTEYDIVHQQHIRVAPKSILPYETYPIEIGSTKRKGTVLLKGTKQDCEKHHANMTPKAGAKPPATPKAQTPQKPVKQKHETASSAASDILADVVDDSENSSTASEADIRNAVLKQLLQLVLDADDDDDDQDNSGQIHKVRCSACSSSTIKSDRYKCLNCKDLNLCGGCFERRAESNSHKSGHAYVHFKMPGELFGKSIKEDDVTYDKLKKVYANEVHESITCDGCSSDSIKGLRFKCDGCPNYDLCQQCVDKGVTTKTHQSTHPLIVTVGSRIQQIPVEDLQIGDEIGSGAFGSVHKGTWKSKKRQVACKVIQVPVAKNAEILEKSFIKEISAYAELSGPYILKTYGFAAAKQGLTKIYIIVMEYMPLGNLPNVIKTQGDELSLGQRLDIARNVASGIRKIHEHHMIHRDIRPDNILIANDYTAKIGDMGIARVADPLNQHTKIGCQSYMPPEFYQGSYDQKLDIFTFGLTLNYLFTSTEHSFQPFVSQDKIAFQEKSPIFDDLIARCTAYDPKLRPTAKEIEKTFDLYGTGFDEIVTKRHPSYQNLPTKDKDEIFIAFYEKFHPSATEFIRKEFPSEFLEEPKDMPCVKVDKQAAQAIRIECPMQ